MSDDFKEMSRMSDAQTARNIGIGLVTGLAGWFAGPVIARRIITNRPLLARNIARGAVFGGLCWVLPVISTPELTYSRVGFESTMLIPLIFNGVIPKVFTTHLLIVNLI